MEQSAREMNLTICKISMSFKDSHLRELRELASGLGCDVLYICHGPTPKYARDDKLVIRPLIRLSAARSRNLAAALCKTYKIIFLDEDASLSPEVIAFIERSDDIIEAACCIAFSGKSQINLDSEFVYTANKLFNLNGVYCEWSFVYDFRCFSKRRLFPGIGVGSRHQFWSGEGLLSLLGLKDGETVVMRRERIFHPPLAQSKGLSVSRRYNAGYGFAMGRVFHLGGFGVKSRALLRFFASNALLIFSKNRVIPPILECEAGLPQRLSLVCLRLYGFLCGGKFI